MGLVGLRQFAFVLAAFAAVPVCAQAASSPSADAASGVGRALGMMLFGYLVLRWFNRKKSDGDDKPQRLLGPRVRPRACPMC